MATKLVALSALFLLCTISCISESHAWPFPWLHPIPHPHPTPLPWQNPKFKTCITALHQRAQNCLHEIVSSYTSQRLSIGSKCCKAIQEVDKDCGSTIFAHFKAPFFHLLLKEHCTNKGCQPKAGSPAPAPKIGGGEPVSPPKAGSPAPKPPPKAGPPAPKPPPKAGPPAPKPPPKAGPPAPKIGGGEPVSPPKAGSPAPKPPPKAGSPAPKIGGGEPALPPMPRDDGDYDPLVPSPSPGSESPAADQY